MNTLNNQPLVIDSFPYAGEETILDIRLHELESVVTKFLIIESNRTQTGLEKPYYFEKQQDKFKEFAPKIVYVKLDNSRIDVGEADWSQEFRVRQAIQNEGFHQLEMDGTILMADSVLIISDADEIPKKESVKDFIKSNERAVCLNHYFNSYYLNLYSRFREPWGWYGSILIRVGSLTNNIQNLRNIKDRIFHTGLEGEGWHFSNLLTNGFDGLYNKWKNNIEPHDKTCLQDKEKLKEQFKKCLYEDNNFFFCDLPDKREILLEKLDKNLLPDYVKKNEKKFKDLLLPTPEKKEMKEEQLNLL